MILGLLLGVAAIYLVGHWIGGVAVVVLLFVWHRLKVAEGPPVHALALTFQWVQVSIGIFYVSLTGRTLPAIYDSDWVTMMLVGLGCLVALTIGLSFGMRLLDPPADDTEQRPDRAFALPTVLAAYVLSVVTSGAVQELAWRFLSITSIILTINFIHLALLFLLLRRFVRPTIQWRWVLGLLGFEVALGFTGYFAGFREPLIMACIVMTEIFDRREPRHWMAMAGLAFVLVGTSWLWMSVRTEYRGDFADELTEATRSERFERIRTLAGGAMAQEQETTLATLDFLVERMWVIYYPAKALERVPLVLPHTNGALMGEAVVHMVTPRALFPDKAPLPSDSEMVRRYAGINVAGEERGTSIAFGYAGEAYVDFGLPWMFVPVFIFGWLSGVSYKYILRVIRHRELAIAVATVIFWLSLYLFERSWAKTLGMHISLLVYLGGITYLVDRYLMGRLQKDGVDFARAPVGRPT